MSCRFPYSSKNFRLDTKSYYNALQYLESFCNQKLKSYLNTELFYSLTKYTITSTVLGEYTTMFLDTD